MKIGETQKKQDNSLDDIKKMGMSVVTVTNRGENIANIVANYDRQIIGLKELIIVLNNDQLIKENIERRYVKRKDIKIYQLPEYVNLGICLNYGYKQTQYKYIAKFDDDDYYSIYYLKEAYDAFVRMGCDIVCKSKIFYYLKRYGELIVVPSLLTAGKYARSGAGATICMTQEAFTKIQYSDLNRGVDLDLFARNKKIGLNVYSTTSYNFLCIRNVNVEEHTWKISAESLRNKYDKSYGIKPISLEEAYLEITHYIQ